MSSGRSFHPFGILTMQLRTETRAGQWLRGRFRDAFLWYPRRDTWTGARITTDAAEIPETVGELATLYASRQFIQDPVGGETSIAHFCSVDKRENSEHVLGYKSGPLS